MKLYEVRIEVDVYVVAEDEDEAERQAKYHIRDEMGCAEISVHPLTAKSAPRAKSVLQSIPYNTPRDHRRGWKVRQWIDTPNEGLGEGEKP